MADKILPIQLQLRYDTYSNWMNSSTILLPGEAAIAVFPSPFKTIELTDDSPENTPPAVGIKVGDGYHRFDELPWVQGVAGDVYAWAKQVTKPTYSASEITNLDTYISNYISGGISGSGGEPGDDGVLYRIVYNSQTKKYILQYFNTDTNTWTNTDSEIDISGILSRLTAIENWANGATSNIGVIDLPIVMLVRDEVLFQLGFLSLEDSAVQHQFVTAVNQSNGKITVSRSTLDGSDITTGTISPEHGGTGMSYVEVGDIIVGAGLQGLTTRSLINVVNSETNGANIPTVNAMRSYVSDATAGLTGAMHFIGETSVTINANGFDNQNPRIAGYDFNNALEGDVILANDHQEYVWTGSYWRLLGDEGSYAIKGSIVNADIAPEANIAQDKIAGLADSFDEKVDKVEGKQLSSNDYTDEDKFKLDHIEEYAQENVIEHIFVNEVELEPKIVDGNPKSIDMRINVLSDADMEKFESIEYGAQVNKIEHFLLNGTEIVPDTYQSKEHSVNLQINLFTNADKAKLDGIEEGAEVNTIEKIYINNEQQLPNANGEVHLNMAKAGIQGALVPSTTAGETEEVPIESESNKLQLARIAKTGLIEDIEQNTYVILYCGTSTDVI